MNVFLFLSAFFWIGGYLSMKGMITLNTNSIFEMNKIVVPPKWLYYLCGAPKTEKYTPGAITIGALRAQLAGIVMGIFSLALNVLRPTLETMVIGLGLCFFVPYLTTLWMSRMKEFAYKEKKRRTNGS